LGGNSAEAKRGSLGLYTGAKIGVFASGNTSNTTLTNLGGNTALATGTNDAVAIATGITVTIGGSTATTKVVSGSDGNDGTIAAGNAVGSS
jgi:hypothetical protein